MMLHLYLFIHSRLFIFVVVVIFFVFFGVLYDLAIVLVFAIIIIIFGFFNLSVYTLIHTLVSIAKEVSLVTIGVQFELLE